MMCAILGLSAGHILCFSQEKAAQPNSFQEHIQKSTAYLLQRRADLAIPELQAAVALEPSNVEAQGNLGVLLFFQGKPADAVPHLRAALQQKPGLSKIQSVLGFAELHSGEIDQGRRDLETAFPLIEEKKLKIQVGLELVGVYTENSDLEDAVPILIQLRKVAPDNPEIIYAAYRTYSDLTSEAVLSLALAAPDSAQMHQILAHEEIKQGNTNGAVEHYRKAIALDPNLPGVHFELAELLHTSESAAIKQEAEKEYKAALAQNPLDEKAVLRLADIDAQRGNTQEAYRGYSKAAALQPSDAEAKLALAKVLIDMNQQDKALPLLEEAVRLEPTNGSAHYRLATLYRKMGRVDDAKREVDTYKKLKDMKEKLRVLYKDLLIQPKEIRADQVDEK